MDIKFECSKCGQHIAVDEAAADMNLPCPSCAVSLTVPSRKLPGSPSPPLGQPQPDAGGRRKTVVLVVGVLASVMLTIGAVGAVWYVRAKKGGAISDRTNHRKPSTSNGAQNADKGFHLLTDAEVEMLRSFIGDDAIRSGIRKLAGLQPYGVVDETVIMGKMKAGSYTVGDIGDLYKFNSPDLSPFKQKGAKQQTIGVIGIPTYTNTFIVRLSQEDCKKVGRSPGDNKIKGTWDAAHRVLTSEETQHCQKVLKDDKIAAGTCSTITLTGVRSPLEKQIVLEVLLQYAIGDRPDIDTRDQLTLIDSRGLCLYRLKTSDLSQVSPANVKK